jgi:hypothetical protein
VRCSPIHCQSNPPVNIAHSFQQSQIPCIIGKTAGPAGNLFYNIYWLAKENEEHQIIQNHPSTAQSPTLRLWYLSNYHDALQAHMHPLHKLGNANSIANNHRNYQTLIENGTANGAASNA